jgi:DNA polymerase III, delta subunit
MNLHDVLMKKAQDQALGHFYIVETSAPPHLAFDHLLTFVHQFIRDYYQKVEGHKQSLANLMDHPDVFVLGNTNLSEEEKSDKFFKVDEAEGLGRFFEFKAVQGIRKFAVITEGHRINTTVANKWLKLFEEPQGTSTIFLLNPRRGQLLPTIHSRAIHLRLMANATEVDLSDWNEFLKDLQTMTFAEFLENYSKADRDLTFWVNELIRWESEQADSASPKSEISKWLKNFQEMEIFHQPTATKWALFYSYIKENVLPRLN